MNTSSIRLEASPDGLIEYVMVQDDKKMTREEYEASSTSTSQSFAAADVEAWMAAVDILATHIVEGTFWSFDYATDYRDTTGASNGIKVSSLLSDARRRNLVDEMPGISTWYTYCGSGGSFFAIHREDSDLII